MFWYYGVMVFWGRPKYKFGAKINLNKCLKNANFG